MFSIQGYGVSGGIVIGRAFFLNKTTKAAPDYRIPVQQVADEVQRLFAARDKAMQDLQHSLLMLEADADSELGSFITLHLAILGDAALLEQARYYIETHHYNVYAALQTQKTYWIEKFSLVEEEYLRNKSADTLQILDLIEKQLHDMLDEVSNISEISSQHLNGDGVKIILADDISPALAIEWRKLPVAAFLTKLGGPVSHTAILAKGMNVPAIVGLKGGLSVIRPNDLLIVDGMRGVVIVNPDDAVIKAYERRREKILRRQVDSEKWRDIDATSLDGQKVSLSANLDVREDLPEVIKSGAQTIGLMRTEFLYLQERGWPAEQLQFEYYADIIRRSGMPVTIRIFDIGADKSLVQDTNAMPCNPALGLRAVRLGLRHEQQLKTQLRAIMRASSYGDVKILLPMVTNVTELRQVKRILQELAVEFARKGYEIYTPELGMMVEVPAAALNLEWFAPYVDFFSIGTNDLIQYTLAIDRVDDEVNYLYDPLHPAVLRLLKMIIESADNLNKPVSMCGEMASNPFYAPLLLWLGLRHFSMEPSTLLAVKRSICMTDIGRLDAVFPPLLQDNNIGAVKDYLEKIQNQLENTHE